mmetsp:Transcript_5260/g.15491  ORF Transcript_5260/g.15491 Transcript_5260/m.15491 type:complete len:238 (+) Transcript_5260:142-855(+)
MPLVARSTASERRMAPVTRRRTSPGAAGPCHAGAAGRERGGRLRGGQGRRRCLCPSRRHAGRGAQLGGTVTMRGRLRLTSTARARRSTCLSMTSATNVVWLTASMSAALTVLPPKVERHGRQRRGGLQVAAPRPCCTATASQRCQSSAARRFWQAWSSRRCFVPRRRAAPCGIRPCARSSSTSSTSVRWAGASRNAAGSCAWATRRPRSRRRPCCGSRDLRGSWPWTCAGCSWATSA